MTEPSIVSTRRKSARAGTSTALLCALTVFCCVAPTRAGDAPPTDRWLLQLAADHALNHRNKRSDADVAQVRVLLKAAQRIKPHSLDALLWLHDLAAGDRDDNAESLLEQITRSDPAHQGAFEAWLEHGARRYQRIEEHRTWLEGLLTPDRPDMQRVAIHARLATLALQQLDTAAAERHLEAADALEPAWPGLADVELGLVPPDAPPWRELRALLRALRANPARIELAWRIGLLLDRAGMPHEAFEFYDFARRTHGRMLSPPMIPSEVYLELSRNALAREAIDEALLMARAAVQAERVSYAPSAYLHWMLLRLGRGAEALVLRTTLDERFAQIQDPKTWDVGIVAEAAWHYCTIDEQPQRALAFAESAVTRAAGDAYAQRVFGWALALNRRDEAAMVALEPVAARDPMAAYRLASLLKKAERIDDAAAVVHALTVQPVAGPERNLLDSLELPGVASQPAERVAAMRRVLAEFDHSFLGYFDDPARFLEIRIEPESLSPAPGESWEVSFTLTNRGSFPITLGPRELVNPVLVLSFECVGDEQREFPGLLIVAIDRVRVLRPRESVSVRRALDVGPIRRILRRSPQRLQRITVRAVLDAERRPDGTWITRIGGQRVPAIIVNRLPAGTSPEAWNAFRAAVTGDRDLARYRALETLAELLGESQNYRLQRLSYQPAPAPTDRIHAVLRTALGSESWETRARTLDALQVVGIDRTLLAAIEERLNDEHWLVRLLAVRLLGQRQAAAFAARAGQIARTDADGLVRELAAIFAEARTPTSAPAAD